MSDVTPIVPPAAQEPVANNKAARTEIQNHFDREVRNLDKGRSVVKNIIRLLKEQSYPGTVAIQIVEGIQFMENIDRQMAEGVEQAHREKKAALKDLEDGTLTAEAPANAAQ